MDDRLDIEACCLSPEGARSAASAIWDAWLDELEAILAELPPDDPSRPALLQYLKVAGAWDKL